MVNFMCQPVWAMRCSDMRSNIIVDVSEGVLDGINFSLFCFVYLKGGGGKRASTRVGERGRVREKE